MRRQSAWLAFSLLVNAATLIVGAVAVPTSWPMYQARPDHNAAFERAKFSRRWTFDAGNRINSGIAVVRDTLYFDTFDGSVIALDVTTGKQIWRTQLDNIVMSTPIVINGSVYVGTGHNGSMETHDADFVYAIGIRTGRSPMWGRPEGDHVVSLDALSGRKNWTYRTAGEDMPSAVAMDQVLIFANGDFNAYAVNMRDGTARWQQEIGGLATMASANRSGPYAILSICSGPDYRGATIAVDASSGHVRWRAAAGDCDSAPTVAAGRVFVSGVDGIRLPYGYGARGTVAALDAATGRVLWRYRTRDAGPYTKVGSNERAIAGCFDAGTYYQAFPTVDELTAFDASSGRVRWRIRTAAPVKMSAIVHRGRLYVGDTAGLFYAIDATSGRIIAVRMFDAPFSVSPPVLVGDTVFAVAGTKVYAFPVTSEP